MYCPSKKVAVPFLAMALLVAASFACGGESVSPPQVGQATSSSPPATVEQEQAQPTSTPKPTETPIADSSVRCSIDAHIHIDHFEGGFDAAAETALATMNEIGIQKSLIMPPPFPSNHPNMYDYRDLAEVVKKNPERFAFLGGGGTLNPMIQEAVRSGNVTADMQREFEAKADEILRAGAAGFGEMTALHFSLSSSHPYIVAPPDHPLFLLLADIAAREGVPIDLHMEAVPQDIPLPTGLESPHNPASLDENIEAFERLLSHNRQARIVWAHAGWDNTGHRTVELMRGLLERHPNLYMNVKISPLDSLPQSRPLQEGMIRSEWMDLIRDFPDRFTIGSDNIYTIPGSRSKGPPSAKATWSLVNQLPEDLSRKVTCENVLMIYRLEE